MPDHFWYGGPNDGGRATVSDDCRPAVLVPLEQSGIPFDDAAIGGSDVGFAVETWDHAVFCRSPGSEDVHFYMQPGLRQKLVPR